MDNLKSLAHSLSRNDGIRRPIHTFWQVFAATLILSATNLAGMPSLSEAEKLALAAAAAGLAAAKAMVVR